MLAELMWKDRLSDTIQTDHVTWTEANPEYGARFGTDYCLFGEIALTLGNREIIERVEIPDGNKKEDFH
jgi:hypothetical protein